MTVENAKANERDLTLSELRERICALGAALGMAEIHLASAVRLLDALGAPEGARKPPDEAEAEAQLLALPGPGGIQ